MAFHTNQPQLECIHAECNMQYGKNNCIHMACDLHDYAAWIRMHIKYYCVYTQSDFPFACMLKMLDAHDAA